MLVSLVSGLILSALGALALKLSQLAKRQRRLGHLADMAKRGRSVQIVLPGFELHDFLPRGTTERAKIPRNMLVMPMAEGSSIAQLTAAFHEIGAPDVKIVRQEEYQDAGLTISIGGPSVNSISHQLLRRTFPEFHIKYPEHIASFGSTWFVADTDSDGALVEDYGFIGFGISPSGNPWVVLCGVWAPGTQMATTALVNLARRSEIRQMIRRRKEFFAVVYGKVDGFVQHSLQIVQVRSRG